MLEMLGPVRVDYHRRSNRPAMAAPQRVFRELQILRASFSWELVLAGDYFTTIFTSLPFTTNTFTISLPAMAAFTFSSARAVDLMASSSASAGRVMRARILPLT